MCVYFFRSRLAGETEGDGQLEGHGEQAEERPGRHAERGPGKGDALRRSQSTAFCFEADAMNPPRETVIGRPGNVWMCQQKQMVYLETQQNEIQAAKEEVRRLRGKMKTFEG